MSSPPSQQRPITATGSLVVVGLCVLFGANVVASKVALGGLGPLTTVAVRYAIAAGAILVFQWATGGSWAVPAGSRARLLGFSLLFAVQNASFYLGLGHTLASRAVLLGGVQPFLVLVLARLLVPGERITLARTLGIALGALGLGVLFAGPEAWSAAWLRGDLVVLGSVIMWATNTVLAKRLVAVVEPALLALYPMVVTVPLAAAAAAAWDHPAVTGVDLPVAVAVLYQAVLTGGLGFVVWNTLLRQHGVVALNAFVVVNPVAGVLLSGLILGEAVLAVRTVASLTLIAAGLVIVNRRGG